MRCIMLLIGILFLATVNVFAAPLEQVWPPDGGPYPYIDTYLKHHNVHRANHSAAPLELGHNMTIAAEIHASTCLYGHRAGPSGINGWNYGQNIEAGTEWSHISEVITGVFYNGEMPNFHWYGIASPFNNQAAAASFDSWGHFSQLIWKGTTHVGCATWDCSQKGLRDASTGQIIEGVAPWFTVCNYWPAGNMSPLYAENMGRPLGHPTVGAQY